MSAKLKSAIFMLIVNGCLIAWVLLSRNRDDLGFRATVAGWSLAACVVIVDFGAAWAGLRRSRRDRRTELEEARLAVVEDLRIRHNPETWTPGKLLQAEYGVSEWRGHHGALRELREWCENPNHSQYFYLHGGPLVGKTRLTIQLAESLRGDNYHLERLLPGCGATAVQALGRVAGKHVICIELARHEPRDIIALMASIDGRNDADRWRVLIVGRADRLPGEIVSAIPSLEDAEELSTGGLIPDRCERDELRRWARRATQHFADVLGVPEPARSHVNLSGERVPVGVLLAHSLQVVYGEDEQRGDLFELLIRAELQAWQATYLHLRDTGAPTSLLRQCFCLAWLLQPLDGERLREVLQPLCGSQASAGEVAEWLYANYPGPNNTLQFPPMLIAAPIALETLQECAIIYDIVGMSEISTAQAILHLLSATSLDSRAFGAASRLLPAVKKFGDYRFVLGMTGSGATERSVDLLLAEWLRVDPPPDLDSARRLASMLQKNQLSDSYLSILGRVVQLEANAPHGMGPGWRLRAGNLMRYSTVLRSRGLFGESVVAAKQAIEVARGVATGDSGGCINLWVRGAVVYAAALLDDDDAPSALRVVKEAQAHGLGGRPRGCSECPFPAECQRSEDVELRRLYGEALVATGSILEGVGVLEDASAVTSHAVESDKASIVDHARILRSLGCALECCAPRAGESVPCLQDSAKAWRSAVALHVSESGSVELEIAKTLLKVGEALRAARSPDAALETCREAVVYTRSLRDQCRASSVDLARALEGLAASLYAKGAYREGIVVARESLVLARALVRGESRSHQRLLAHVLVNYGHLLVRRDPSLLEDALAAHREAVDLLRDCGTGAARTGELAWSLTYFAATLREVGLRSQAVAPLIEALDLWAGMRSDGAGSTAAYRVVAMELLGVIYCELANWTLAVPLLHDAVALSRITVAGGRPADLARFAELLGNYASALVRCGRSADAEVIAAERTSVISRLASGDTE